MRLLRLSGHSGAGKSRLIRALPRLGMKCPRAVIYTSRPPRPGEVHGVDYYFLSSSPWRMSVCSLRACARQAHADMM
ncbi:MAG: hypothetical protein FJW31_30330 [Acidobacteria bacterium]|nr:hypothetical protein [Acidobacteriota bacterium]